MGFCGPSELAMSNPQQEPTMEEILASIRKIISEDTPEGSAGAPAPVHDDVLELTQEVVDTPPAPPPAPAPAPMPAPVEDQVFENVAAAPAAHSDIFSDQTRKAMEDSFSAISSAPAAPSPARYAASRAPADGSSLENVFERAVSESFEPVLQKYLSDNSAAVIDRMKPLIREWMDDHFPALLEGAVRAEVERVVKSRAVKR
jgi:cell pole-organizing protein PopZ